MMSRFAVVRLAVKSFPLYSASLWTRTHTDFCVYRKKNGKFVLRLQSKSFNNINTCILYVFNLSLLSCVALPEFKFLIWSSPNGEKLAGLHLVTSANL